MAKAITHIEKQVPNQTEERAQAIQQILDEVADSHESLLVFLDIVKELHNAGFLDIVQGVLKNRQQIGVIAMSQMNQPGMHHILKNGINTLQFLGNLEPDRLQRMLNALARGIERFSEQHAEKTSGIWGLSKALRDPDVGVSLATMVNFMRGMGEELNKEQKSVH